VAAVTGLLPSSASAALRKLHVGVRGSDAGRCTKIRPCRSFDRAYRVARPGQTVIVHGGIYPDQSIRRDGRKTSRRNVVFRPARGARVVIATDLDVYGSHITFSSMRVLEDWHAQPGARDLVFTGIRSRRFNITSAGNIRLLRSNVGPSFNSVAQIKSASGSTVAPSRIVLKRVTMHDFRRTNIDQHMECLHVMAVNGLVVQRSKFRDCSIFGISFNEHGESNKMRGIVLENNYFDKSLDGGDFAVHFSSGDPCEALIRYNTFLQGISNECPETGNGVRIHSNILPRSPSSCGTNGYSWNWNVYESGSRCGPNDRVARVSFVNRLRFDLRLAAGSAALGRGNPRSFPRIDIQGQRRPAGRAPDAGADERRRY
jgi:hypothetical protein